MKRLLLDTHVWLRYVAGSEDLPRSLRSAIDDAVGSCCLSPISAWEALNLARKKRIRVGADFDAWLDQVLEAFPVRSIPLTLEIVRTVRKLSLQHCDPADHFLAATAIVHKLTLVTLDRELVAAEQVPTLTA